MTTPPVRTSVSNRREPRQPQQRKRLSYQLKMLVVTSHRFTAEKQATLLRLARELEALGQ